MNKLHQIHTSLEKQKYINILTFKCMDHDANNLKYSVSTYTQSNKGEHPVETELISYKILKIVIRSLDKHYKNLEKEYKNGKKHTSVENLKHKQKIDRLCKIVNNIKKQK